ncbi:MULTISPECIES: response regulator [unclassified Streptomyces]|uniref:Response regulator transcription factor n=1 Tax=Streptomyces sp. NBC_00060 TaxID=2975636 RepID=A0AAU2GVB0_9ACTN
MIRVLLVDDETLIRSGLRALLSTADAIEVVAEGASGTDALRLAVQHPADVVLMDIQMPGMNGLAATAALTALPQPPKVLLLTNLDADENVLQALAAGAHGFLRKTASPDQIVNSVRLVASGGTALMPEQVRSLLGEARLQSPQRARTARARLAELNDRQREILVLVGHGHSNAHIARTLRMTEGTVKTYLSRILGLLGLENRTQAALLIYDAGLLSGGSDKPSTR